VARLADRSGEASACEYAVGVRPPALKARDRQAARSPRKRTTQTDDAACDATCRSEVLPSPPPPAATDPPTAGRAATDPPDADTGTEAGR